MKGFIFGLLYIVFFLILASPWIINAVKLTDCDFESPYKCEVIHGAGLFGPLALVAVWFDSDASQEQTPTQ
jgi:hypothetical protein